MSHTFKIPLKVAKEDVLDHIESTLPEHGLTLVRTDDGARISGRGFKGCVRFAGRDMVIEVTDKPFIVPWSLVESKLKAFFSG